MKDPRNIDVHEKLMKLMDNGVISQKSINTIDQYLFEQAFNDYKQGKVFVFDIDAK
jgi:hypothetical protein